MTYGDDDDVRFTLRYPKHTDDNLEALAAQIGVSKSAVIRKILYEYFQAAKETA